MAMVNWYDGIKEEKKYTMNSTIADIGEWACKFLAKHGFVIYDKKDDGDHFIGYTIIGLLTIGAIGGPLIIIYRLIEKAIAFFGSL